MPCCICVMSVYLSSGNTSCASVLYFTMPKCAPKGAILNLDTVFWRKLFTFSKLLYPMLPDSSTTIAISTTFLHFSTKANRRRQKTHNYHLNVTTLLIGCRVCCISRWKHGYNSNNLFRITTSPSGVLQKLCTIQKRYNTIRYYTIRYDTMWYNTIQYNIIQYNIIQYN